MYSTIFLLLTLAVVSLVASEVEQFHNNLRQEPADKAQAIVLPPFSLVLPPALAVLTFRPTPAPTRNPIIGIIGTVSLPPILRTLSISPARNPVRFAEEKESE